MLNVAERYMIQDKIAATMSTRTQPTGNTLSGMYFRVFAVLRGQRSMSDPP
jgi:hypothetical protein